MLHAVLKGEPMLKLTNISKQYEGSSNFTLNNINLEFESTGLVSILGPSGCGKTTLLNLIGGLDTPTSGSILIDNYELTKLKKIDLDRYHNQYVGFVYQNYNLINYLNVVDNIELINKNKEIDLLLDYLHLKDKAKKQVKYLSGGEKQRVSIARSLSNNPRFLLCDEPTGALDTKTSHEIMKLLKEISKTTLVIMVTHNEELAKRYSDRIIALEDGDVKSDTKAKTKCTNSSFSFKKIHVSISKILNIITKNIKSKYKRNFLTVTAFSIGLISLGLVLSISAGFNKSMEREEKESLSKYPIYISETSTNLNKDLKNIFSEQEKVEDDYIYKIESTHTNIIDESYIKGLSKLEQNINNQINSYLIDGKVLSISKKPIDEIIIKSGRNIENANELLLVVNNNQIDGSVLLSLGLKEEKYKYEDIINYQVKINKNKYKIVGIASFDDESYYQDVTGILSYDAEFNSIPVSISLYPKDYENKSAIIKHLDSYPQVEYTDYSSTLKSVSKTLMDGVTIILLCFSMISLIVSTIMIGIISYISVIERIKEIGLFKSLGLSSRNIKVIFIGENILLGIISSMFSFDVLKIISIPINKILTNITGMTDILLINSNILIVLLSISIILSIIGSYFPIRKTKKLKIIDCLRYE